MRDTMLTAGMLADNLRSIVLGASDQDDPMKPGPSCLDGTPMIPLHRGTVTAIYSHLERLAAIDGEMTQRAREYPENHELRSAILPSLTPNSDRKEKGE